ncbi:T/G mismatch-specific endonuclease [Geodermatophilus saharensis]|uniref:T/G mismatch-specific endonuclease n=1 Tax=Geodermatophilus saharensis TaxID=1137994 RepID=A0A239EBK8_9ACTN|nr:T/G mismatch-specific endonuclease [Geodermatophilus saharensis]
MDVRPRPRPEARPELARGEGDGVLAGCFWHGCPTCGHLPEANQAWWAAKLAGNTARDRRADAVLTGLGWRALRFWEHEDPDDVADAIYIALGRVAPGQSPVSVVPRA